MLAVLAAEDLMKCQNGQLATRFPVPNVVP
jgi:hypothetical protein